MKSFQDVVDAFGGVTDFAEAMGQGRFWAKKVRERDSLNVVYFAQLVDVAKARGLPLTMGQLLDMAEARRALGAPSKRQPDQQAAA